MRYTTLRVAIAFVTSVILIGAGTGISKSQTLTEPQEGWVLINEEDFIIFDAEREYHFHKARENFFKKDMEASAAEIRKGLVYLKLEASRSTKEGTKALMALVHELEQLADAVEKGTVTSVKELDNAFACAHHALATHHHLKASESWAESWAGKYAKKVGYHLQAVARHLEHALTWSGHKLEAGSKEVIEEMRLLAGKLIEGTGSAPMEVGKVMEETGKEIEKVGKKIEPMRK